MLYRCLMVMEDTKPQCHRLTTQHRRQPVTTRGPQVLLQSQLLYRGSSLLHHRGLHHQGIGVLHHNLRCSRLLHRGSQALYHQRTGVLRGYVCCPSLLVTTPSLTIITLLQLTIPRLPNTIQYPATYLQLHSGCFIVLRWSELLLRGSSLLHQNLRFPPAATLKLLFTATQRHPSITPLLRLLRPNVPKLRSIPLPQATTPLRHLNVTSQPMLLQPLCNLKLIFNENKFFNASNYLVRLLNTSKHFNIASMHRILIFILRRTTVA
jgi:hypothetical protein